MRAHQGSMPCAPPAAKKNARQRRHWLCRSTRLPRLSNLSSDTVAPEMNTTYFRRVVAVYLSHHMDQGDGEPRCSDPRRAGVRAPRSSPGWSAGRRCVPAPQTRRSRMGGVPVSPRHGRSPYTPVADVSPDKSGSLRPVRLYPELELGRHSRMSASQARNASTSASGSPISVTSPPYPTSRTLPARWWSKVTVAGRRRRRVRESRASSASPNGAERSVRTDRSAQVPDDEVGEVLELLWGHRCGQHLECPPFAPGCEVDVLRRRM